MPYQPPIKVEVESDAELDNINLKKNSMVKQSNILQVLSIIRNLDSWATPSGVKNTSSLVVFAATFSCTTSTNLAQTVPWLAIEIFQTPLTLFHFCCYN